MKKVCLSILIVATQLSLVAQDVVIPDSIFKASLLAIPEINLNGDTEIQMEEATSYNGTLNLVSKGIADFTGIEAFTSLSQLFAGYNNAQYVDLSNNKGLVLLDFTHNQLDSITLGELDQLRVFICNANNLHSLDLTTLPELNAFSGFENNFRTVDFSQNPKLNSVILSYNPVEEIDLSANVGLGELFISDTNLSQIDVSFLPQLRILWVDNNDLDTLDISQNLNLLNLDCSNTNDYEIDLTQHTKLREFTSDDNHYETLDLSQNLELVKVLISDNNISTLQLPASDKLERLICQGNELTEIDIRQNPNMNHFVCGNNKIKKLDISDNPLIGFFVSRYNDLDSLNVRNGNNVNFRVMNTTDNPNLTCIITDDEIDPDDPPPYWYKDDWAEYTTAACMTTWLDEVIDPVEVAIYPNPTDDFLLLSQYDKSLQQVTVYNTAGQVVLQQDVIDAQSTSLNLKQLSAGTYLVKLLYEGREEVQRVMRM